MLDFLALLQGIAHCIPVEILIFYTYRNRLLFPCIGKITIANSRYNASNRICTRLAPMLALVLHPVAVHSVVAFARAEPGMLQIYATLREQAQATPVPLQVRS